MDSSYQTKVVDLIHDSKDSSDMTRSLSENTVMTSDSAVHPEITRAGRKEP